jgi:hypothetical protein
MSREMLPISNEVNTNCSCRALIDLVCLLLRVAEFHRDGHTKKVDNRNLAGNLAGEILQHADLACHLMSCCMLLPAYLHFVLNSKVLLRSCKVVLQPHLME